MIVGAGLGGVFNVNDEVGDISKSQQYQGLTKDTKAGWTQTFPLKHSMEGEKKA